MTIDNHLLRKKVEKIEKEFDCALSIDEAITLIKKIQKEYTSLQKKRFKSLVKRQVKKMKLDYNYCRLMFSYFGSSKKKKKGGRERCQQTQQTFLKFL